MRVYNVVQNYPMSVNGAPKMNFMVHLVFSSFIICTIEISTSRSQFDQFDDSCGFRCGNTSECIRSDNICDGVVDCPDGSDESNSCKRIRCQNFLFTCDYGACINKRSVCDGKEDCRDGSDEMEENCPKNGDDSACVVSEFKCNDGTCINEDAKCDGKYDCIDQSDETEETCATMLCPSYVARCKYGACINKRKICDGKIDCVDKSDEEGCPGTPGPPTPTPVPEPPVTVQPTRSGSCIIPQYPNHGKLILPTKPDYLLTPGESVDEGTVLFEECNKGFAVEEMKNFILCLNGKWTRQVSSCLKMCPPLTNTTRMTVTCSRVGSSGALVSCENPVQNVIAKFKCEPHYEDASLKQNPTRFCNNGKWNPNLPNCAPECGIKNVKAQTLIIGGSPAAKGDYPWQVALYELIKGEQVLICGGSLINQKVVLTAAHCVADIYGKVQPKERYTIAVGKYYRPFDHPNDTEAQFSKVAEIIVHPNYRGNEFKYLADIALLVAEEAFKLSDYVLPICVDWGDNYDRQLGESGTKGIVTGWGYTVQAREPSNILKEIVVPYIVGSQCEQELPPDYRRYLTSDKICSGYINESIGVCDGDSGGALVFRKPDDGKYYVRGLVSLSPKESESCNVNTYALYTKVSSYVTFISEHQAVYQEL